MGLMDRIKKVTGTNEAYDEAYDEDYYKGFDGYDDGAEDDSDMQIANGQMGGGMGQQNMGAPMGQPMQSAAGGIGLSGNNIQMQVVRVCHHPLECECRRRAPEIRPPQGGAGKSTGAGKGRAGRF